MTGNEVANSQKGESKMKRTIFTALVFLLLVVPASKAQTVYAPVAQTTTSVVYAPLLEFDNSIRLLVGPTGGMLFDNTFFGVNGGMEVPVGKHFEADIYDTIAGEKHTALGGGWTNSIQSQGIIWATSHLGVNSGIQDSIYSVTGTSKNEYFYNGGLVVRANAWVPTRFTFNYIREIANGIMSNGDETNHLQGGSFIWDSLVGCGKGYCVRFQTNIQAGRVLTQGNPVCDGTYGNGSQATPSMPACPRTGAMSGGASFTLLFKFGHHENEENQLF